MAQKPPTSPRWLTIAESAQRIHKSTRTVRTYIAAGTLKAYRIRGSRSILIDAADVDALLVPIPATDGGAA